ncbi:cation-translocating P-type ATPase [Patescibacteria group bacterium]|nr:cation-translocating P-type ATPase [Patescibacteria group bacterium]
MINQGLTSEEAAKLLEQFGKNEIISGHKIRPLEIFISQFKSFLILILFIAAILASLAGEKLDTIVIIVIIVLNSIFGFIQEYRAEKAIAALKHMVVTRVRVIRDGKEIEINTVDLVPGDAFIIEEGQKIPADGKLVEAVNLQLNEASLTGESLPVSKKVNESEEDDKFFIFMGTIAEKGKGMAIVTATGMKTKFGKIASLLKDIKEEPTPLQKHLDVLGKQLGIIAVFGAILVFGFGFLHGGEILETMLTGASLAVAVVPEGLPAIVTITLAVGVQRMSRRQSIIRKLSSIEAIGSVDVICSDKTGTMTKNEMIVRKVWVDGQTFDVEDEKLNNKGFAQLLRIGILCNDASILEENGKLTILGDRTEGSLLVLAKEKGVNIKEYKGKGSAIEEFPFDSSLKRMSVVWSEGSKKEIYVKGAPEIIISRSTKILSDGKLTDLDTSEKKKLSKVVEDLAGNGFRLLGFGYKEFKGEPDKIGRDEVEKDLIFVGIVAIADPPRDEVKEAIKLAKNAGIKVVMITGDNPLTAKAIGAEIGLIEGNEKVISGDKLEKMSQPELEKTIRDIKIFARVTPEHKLRIVKAFQAKGSTVGVTGDGVNDAPALKQADVGLSMGIIGTDVAKEASDMVIADDNFASIIKAVEEGRVIYENILKSIRYLLACNAGELIAILGAVAIGFPSPLTPIQILWMNLVTDGLPALALAGDPKAHDTMNRPPRNKSVPILTILGKKFIITVGVILATATLVTFIVFLKFDELEKGRTVAFTILVLGQMVVAFLVRKGEKWNSNRLLLVAVLATVILQIIILITPALHSIFDVVPLI